MTLDTDLDLTTPLCRILGIRYPVLQAGMMIAANGRLAAAVSNAGGLGTIGSYPGGGPESGQLDAVRREIRLAKSLTDQPFSQNIPIALGHSAELLEVAHEEGVPIVSLTAGNPTELAARAHGYGMTVIGVVGAAAQAQRAEASGADIVVVEGTEAGGLNHPDGISILTLLPKIARTATKPLVAAGGFADGRGLAAALCLGASGVQMGTRFLASEECHVHDAYKQAIVDAGSTGTVLLGANRRRHSRSLRTPFTAKLWEMEHSNATDDDIQAFTASGEPEHTPQMLGLLENGSAPAGMSSYLVEDVLPAGEIVRTVVRDAIEVLRQMAGYVEKARV